MPVRQPFIEIAGRDRIARTRQLCGLQRDEFERVDCQGLPAQGDGISSQD